MQGPIEFQPPGVSRTANVFIKEKNTLLWGGGGIDILTRCISEPRYALSSRCWHQNGMLRKITRDIFRKETYISATISQFQAKNAVYFTN